MLRGRRIDSSNPLELIEALQKLRDNAEPIKETLVLPIREAMGYSLAANVIADHDQPPFPRSPFDGYAIKAEDTEGASMDSPMSLKVITEVDAGDWFEGELNRGEAIRIMTGAPIPDGANAIIKQEETDYGEETVKIFREMRYKQNYIEPGEDYTKGTILLEKGEHLGPVEIGILASNGMEKVAVFRKPRIVVISTGSELMAPSETLKPGKIYDANRYTIAGQLEVWGCEVLDVLHTMDEPEACMDIVKAWDGKADAVVTTGGVSVGKKDIMHDVFEGLEIEKTFWKVGIKPGAAMLSGKYKNMMILSLSGNPYAAYVDLHLFVREYISELKGNNKLEMIRQKAKIDSDYNRSSPIRRFVRCYVQNGCAYVENHLGGNGDITSGRHINGLIDIPAGSGPLKAGDIVDVIML